MSEASAVCEEAFGYKEFIVASQISRNCFILFSNLCLVCYYFINYYINSIKYFLINALLKWIWNRWSKFKIRK